MKKCLIHDWKYDGSGDGWFSNMNFYKCARCKEETTNPENSLNDICNNIYNSLVLINSNIHFMDVKTQVQKILKNY